MLSYWVEKEVLVINRSKIPIIKYTNNLNVGGQENRNKAMERSGIVELERNSLELRYL